MKTKLAIHGGRPAVNSVLEKYKWVGHDVMPRLEKLILSNSFSGFLAQPNSEHFGGPNVKKLEALWSQIANVEYSVSFNSWTSGLMAAMASLNLEKGSEVIVSPWTMSASVACIVANDLVPVFADIDPETFNIDPNDVERKVTKNTSAILAIDIFGKPCEAPRLSKISVENNLKFVIDSAQTPRATVLGIRSSTYSDISGISFNRHKHIQVGEGGIAFTNNLKYAERLRLIRNHAEVTNAQTFDKSIKIGHNWRLGEIEALLAIYQLENFDRHVKHRVTASLKILNILDKIPSLLLPKVLSQNEHDFYIIGIKLNERLKSKRGEIASALKAEGVTNLLVGYQALHRLPSFMEYEHFGLTVVNELHDFSFLGLYMCGHYFKDENIFEIGEAFKKVFNAFDN